MKSKSILIGSLISLLSLLIVGEAIARFIDPFGIGRARSDTTNLHFTFQPDATRLYTLTPGAYTFSNWSLTVNDDTFRRVPDTHPQADCTIALLGDSLTFGFGVSDNETFANVLAQRYSQVHLLNTGVSGYNTILIERTASTLEVDGYLYLLIGNDAQVREFDTTVQGHEPVWIQPTLKDYLSYLTRGATETTPVDMAAFKTAYAKLRTYPHMHIVGFETSALTPETDARPIAMYNGTVSKVDAHPNAQGHVEIADAVDTEFAALVEKAC